LSLKAYFGHWQTRPQTTGAGAICEIFATLGKSFRSDTLQIGFPAPCTNLQQKRRGHDYQILFE
jgi:hypothetical protein